MFVVSNPIKIWGLKAHNRGVVLKSDTELTDLGKKSPLSAFDPIIHSGVLYIGTKLIPLVLLKPRLSMSAFWRVIDESFQMK